MNTATFSSLTAAERALVLQTERPALAELDEEALFALLDRVRKQRSKNLSLYRRGASARVEAKGARGTQRLGGPPREALKAEVWEEAIGRISARLAQVSRARAADLKQERIALARGEAREGVPTPVASKVKKSPKRAREATPAERKKAAATKSAGTRRQAARDAKS